MIEMEINKSHLLNLATNPIMAMQPFKAISIAYGSSDSGAPTETSDLSTSVPFYRTFQNFLGKEETGAESDIVQDPEVGYFNWSFTKSNQDEGGCFPTLSYTERYLLFENTFFASSYLVGMSCSPKMKVFNFFHFTFLILTPY